jgi:hypothetical protein
MIKKVKNSFLSVTIGSLILFLLSSRQKPSSTDVERGVQTSKENVTRPLAETRVDSQITHQPINIISPSDRTSVCWRTMVRGKISKSNLQVFILIHPMATDKFWVQPIPNMRSDGRWEAYCFFGEQNQGIGEPFEIIAVASGNRNLFRRGDTLPSPMPDNPQIVVKSKPVTVTRDPCLHR